MNETAMDRQFVNVKAKLADAQKVLTAALAELSLLETMHRIGMQTTPEIRPALVPVQPVPERVKAEAKPAPAKIEVVQPVEPLTITDEWRAVLAEIDSGEPGVFVTGPAGTGKSSLLNHAIENHSRAYAIVAPTGVAALRVGGSTIHRFFGFKAEPLHADNIQTLENSRREKYRALGTLFVDEISMVRADLMDGMDLFLRKNGQDKDQPFGGVRVVMFGDPFQLPPVAKEKSERAWLNGRYGTEEPYFFHGEIWRNNALKTHNLTHIFRQKDPKFTETLNAIRAGVASADHLALINSRVNSSFKPSVDDLWITLTTTNEAADHRNQQMLNALPGPSKVFEALVSGDFNIKDAPTDEFLTLKPGAVVMFVRNDADRRWVNGTMGKVVSVNPLKVEVEGAAHEVDTEKWEQIAYEYDPMKKTLAKTIKGQFIQYPIRLAAAITIHKGQGQTYDRCVVDLGHRAFASGQAYVGLSRCRTLEGMVLRRALRNDDLIVSTEVQRFMRGEPIARPAGQLSLLEGLKS